MASWNFSDVNINNLIENRYIDVRQQFGVAKEAVKEYEAAIEDGPVLSDILALEIPGGLHQEIDDELGEIAAALDFNTNHWLLMHSSLIKRLSLEKEFEFIRMFGCGIIAGKLHNDKSGGWISGSRFTTPTEIGHQGCVNAIAWNSKGSLLVCGSDDTRVNLWSYTSKSLLHSIDSGHTANIFCTKFVPETSDELVVSGAGDAEVEVGNPNVVWSASEDGNLRQHDFREGFSCPHAGSSHKECHNILLDLRFGAKKSLADPPKHWLALKSCDISTTRHHKLLVGDGDAFAGLYDRRVLLPLSSSQKRMKPLPCGRSTLHLTHVTFSLNGEEVLVSYSGEHVYLMDANLGSKGVLRYSVEDVAKQLHLAPTPSEMETVQDLMAKPFHCSNDGIQNCNNPTKLQQCQELLEAAEKCLERSGYLNGIKACNELLDGKIRHFGPELEKWKNDVHMAIRDCSKARSKDPSSYRAYFCPAEALLELRKHKEALEYATVAHHLAPSNFQVSEMVENIKQHLASEAAENNNNGSSKESRKGKSRSLRDVNHQKEANSDACQDCPRPQREDADIQEDIELDFETSMLDDEGHDIELGILCGSLNLRFQCKPNGSCGSPSSSSQTENLTYQPEVVIDMKQRYVGHYNVGTDIKQASFLGQNGEHIASGSDDGKCFIWEKKTGRLVKMLAGDESVVNCVQCYPFDCTIATSGIDDTIKIWTPQSEVPSIVAGGTAGPETADVLSAMEANQRKLLSREHVLSFELLERFRMHDFAEGTLHPFECAQS